MKALLISSLGLLLISCSHTIDFRASHFAVPVTEEQAWSGHAAAVATGVTKITVVNDMTSNPPGRTGTTVNKDVNVTDLLGVSNISVDASLHVWRGLELFLDGSLAGARFQFLNHGAKDHVWVGAVHGAYAERTSSSSSTSSGVESKASCKVKTSQAGISVGYKFNAIVPYFAYIHEAHEVSTTVTNGHGSFGPYPDLGAHDYYSIGLTSHGRGLRYAIEYSMIQIDWDRSDRAYQNAVGAKVGFAW